VAGPEATLRSLMGSRPPLAAARPFPYDAAPLRNACPPLQPHKGLCKLLNSILVTHALGLHTPATCRSGNRISGHPGGFEGHPVTRSEAVSPTTLTWTHVHA